MKGALASLVRSNALAAMVAQVWQAVGSFGLLLAAGWMLGASGLGVVSLCLSIIVLATAVASGMVGDSLVVLDRHDRATRAGLQFWALLLAAAAAVVGGVATYLTGLLDPVAAVLFAAALAAFMIEELVRRTFMAMLSFWRLVIIDSSAVVVSLGVVALSAAFGTISIVSFLLGVLLGQLVGITVGVLMMPSNERRLVSLRGAGIRQVAGFGTWRGLQVAVPPAVLTATRVLVTAIVGAAALGSLEAARVLVAPALLAVQGFGSYLLSSYVHGKHHPVSVLRTKAWRASLGLMGAAIAVGLVLVLAAPQLAGLVIGPNVPVDRLAVAGWVLYVVGSASCQPFASLAAARGKSAGVLICRSIDATAAVLIVILLLGPLAVSASWVPFALAFGLFVGGVLVRQFVLRPLVTTQSDSLAPAHSRTSYAAR